jgi:hypothetical protein
MTEVPELATKRYIEFVDSFNKLNLVDYQLDVDTFNHVEILKTFHEKISTNEILFKYLLNKDKILFHKKYKLVFLPKINLYNLIESDIDETLISFVWETIQMIYLIIADNQNELTKKQDQVNALLDTLDGLGKKKGTFNLKKISDSISNMDPTMLTEFLTLSGLDKLDFTKIDIKQFQDMKGITPDKIKNIIASTGFDKIDVNGVIDKLSEKGDGELGKKYIIEILEKLIEDYTKESGDDKMDNLLNFAIDKAQDKLQEFLIDGKLTIYDIVAGSKVMREDKKELSSISEKLKKSKLFRDCTSISIKELIGKFTSRIMAQVGKEKATGNISEDQMKGLEEFLKNQKL